LSYSSSLTIEELDANLAALRTLELRGGGLPKQGAGWGIDGVVPTTWYPGNPDDATQQVLVTKEMPSSWEGEWNVTRLTRSPCKFADAAGRIDITSPGVLVDVFEDFARHQRLLRVTWAVDSTDVGTARKIVRLGRIGPFEAKYTRSVDVVWSVTFHWKSRGGVQARVVSTRDDNVQSAGAALSAAIGASLDAAANAVFLANNPNVRSSASQFTLGQLERIAAYPLSLVKSVTQALGRIVGQFQELGAIANQIRSLPFAIANNVLDFARNAIDVGNQFGDQMSRVPAEQRTNSNNVADLTRSMSYFGQHDDATILAVRQAQQAQSQIRSAASTNPSGGEVGVAGASGALPGQIITIRLTRKGDTPQSLAMLYYQTPDRDIDILRANRLPWYQASFHPGTLVVIPVVSSSTSP
jgi:hypothetical protein